ncbi:MAG TPA: hypothetical protein VME22_06945 [Solirubrobacteraceae bacterium]|nr:hypothetical protein [Solirubrobacteraceae bacterium]
MPDFFVPDVPNDEAERTLATLAELAGSAVPPPDRRPYRATWMHDGQEWTAEVGKRLHGVQVHRTSRGHPGKRLNDGARVLAIFPGRVVTDARPVGQVPSAWANPFFTGECDKIEYFTVGEGSPDE